MKLKLDENLPDELGPELSSHGHDVHTVHSESLTGDVRKFAPGTHPGIVLIRLRNPSRRRLIERVLQVFHAEDVAGWARCFVVISDRKLRVRRP